MRKEFIVLGKREHSFLDGYGLIDSYARKITGTNCAIHDAFYFRDRGLASLCHEVSDRKRLRRLMEKEPRAGKYNEGFFATLKKEFGDCLEKIIAFS